MRFVAADISVLKCLIVDKGGVVSHGGRFLRASYIQTQGGVGEADIPLRLVQQQETATAAHDYHVYRCCRYISLPPTVRHSHAFI